MRYNNPNCPAILYERKVKTMCMTLRIATQADAPALLAIYAPYVLDTAITFEYDVPTTEEFAARIRHTLARYPYIVAEAAGEIIGYAYAGPFHSRAAYDWSVETSIYVRRDRRRSGVGRALYAALERLLLAQGITNLNACIATPFQEDAHLTLDSVRFHERLGYRFVGEFHQCGYKFGRWYNMAWMEKHIAPHRSEQPPVTPFARMQTDAAHILASL